MPVTRELLARLRTLDDLIEFVAALGYVPCADELNAEAQRRLGLTAPGLGIRRAAILGRAGTLAVYGLVADHPVRGPLAVAVERLARTTAGGQHLLLALDSATTTLACAAAPADHGSAPARQLRISLRNPSPVALEILSGLAVRPGDGALRHAARIAETLAEEGLTSRFFREFRRLHAHAAEQLGAMPRATATERHDLALVILTRVLFLYFVQAKGWLAGRSDFLPSALDTALGRGHPFHRRVFEPLCFGALSTPRHARQLAARALGDLPFLNGGLFERHRLERCFPDATLPNDAWRELFDGLFERFHFTAREDGDGDAVDPEMLGRVFEGLMGETERRTSGTYFTPRSLVRELVESALAAAGVRDDQRAIESVRILDPAVGSGAFLLEALHQLELARGPLRAGESTAARRRAIVRDNLFGVDADPMAVRLAELRLWLAMVVDDDATPADVAPLPNLDWNVRQGDSLLSPLDGVAWAASSQQARVRSVAERKTRFYVASGRDKAALARAIRGDERVLALTALDGETAALTSRIADAASLAGRDLFGARARRAPVTERRVAGWRRHRRELVALRRRVVEDEALPFFSYPIHFGEAAASGGFDVILGNPPWVRGEALPASLRTALARRYAAWRVSTGSAGFAHVPDLSVAFVERALELVRPEGVVAFLLPAKLLRAGYAAPLRALLRREATVLSLGDRAHAGESGFAATVFPMTLVVRRRAPAPDLAAEVTILGATGRTIQGAAAQRDLALAETPPGAPWLALPSDLVHAVRSALASGPALRDRFRPTLGVKTGANEVFVRRLGAAHDLPDSCRAPALLGRDLEPFALAPSAVMLAAVDEQGHPLASVPDDVRRYLQPHTGRLRRRADARCGRVPAWALFRTDLLRSEWIVLWRDIAPRLEAAVLHRDAPSAPIPLNTCYGAPVPDEFTAAWLSALLNSRLIRSLAASLAERASGGAFRFSAGTVGALPLPSDQQSGPVRALAVIGCAAAHGEPYDPDDLDAFVALALGLGEDVSQRLRYLGDALCRDAGGHR
jgi:hypothetical protein